MNIEFFYANGLRMAMNETELVIEFIHQYPLVDAEGRVTTLLNDKTSKIVMPRSTGIHLRDQINELLRLEGEGRAK